ncbi:winged helix-turn-helix transcriptional regulator [Arenicella xantha]|uniref:HxlR family transcriptional regulator n=1 Tax=Arenicella xantha TaxID=644221 RepID=A0A395JJM8_9GAMM|nr:helix-turn-helix domain-containing protein [Arenicella xantha]RBP50719.1 HxlR family transcriptional regulator [Arenicella xantha]
MTNQLILNEPIAAGLDVIGDRWTLLILREAFYGATRFEQFCHRVSISRATLTRRLNALIEKEILYRAPTKASSKRFEYKFTQRGLSLMSSSLLALQWEADWRQNNDRQHNVAQRLYHRVCGERLAPKPVCRACDTLVAFNDVSWLDMSEQLDNQLDTIRASNAKHRKRVVKSGKDEPDTDPGLASMVGDRWTILILIACFFGARKFDAFINQLNIPSSVLAERLKLLAEAKVLRRDPYQNNPVRYEYHLTDKGKSLFPFIMSLRQWVVENMLEASQVNNRLVHNPCGNPLTLDVVCAGCGQKPWPQDIEWKR